MKFSISSLQVSGDTAIVQGRTKSLGGGVLVRVSSPTVRRRELAYRLKALRLSRGLTLDEAAAALEFSAATMSRIENGLRLPRARDVRDLSQLYGVEDSDAARLMTLVEASRETGWWEAYTEVDDDYGTLIGLEAAATSVGEYQSITIPGLLQTPDYIRAYTLEAINPRRAKPYNGLDIDKRIEVTRIRQEVLQSPAHVKYAAFLDEGSLLRRVGGPDVMAAQMDHIANLAHRENISVRVIPFDCGAHPGQPGSFCVIELPAAVPDVVYVDSPAGQIFLETREDLERHLRVLDRLQDIALSRDESEDAFRTIASGFRV